MPYLFLRHAALRVSRRICMDILVIHPLCTRHPELFKGPEIHVILLLCVTPILTPPHHVCSATTCAVPSSHGYSSVLHMILATVSPHSWAFLSCLEPIGTLVFKRGEFLGRPCLLLLLESCLSLILTRDEYRVQTRLDQT